MILLIPLVLTLVLCADTPPPALEWSSCDVDKKCFCTDKSVPQDTALKISTYLNDKCDNALSGVQTKFLTADTALFQLQVIGSTQGLGNNPSLMLFQGTEKLFGCIEKAGTLEIDGDPAMITRYRISLFEDRSRFTAGHSLCSIKMDHADTFRSWITDFNNPRRTEQTSMHFLSVKYVHVSRGVEFFDFMDVYCDPYSFKDQTVSVDFDVEPIINRDKDELDCANYGVRYSMRYESESGEGFAMKKLTCDKTTKQYKIVKVDDTEEAVDKPESFSFFCAAPLNETCINPISDCTQGKPECPTFTNGSPGKAASLTCPDKKWLIGGEHYELREDPICKEDPMTKKAAFYTQFENTEERTEEGQCFTEYDCKKKSKLDYPFCKEDDDTCSDIDYSNAMMKCKDDKRQITVTNFKTNVTQTAMNFTCDPKTGMWQNSNKENIEENSQVRCIGDTNFVGTTSKFTKNALIGAICGIIGGGVVLVIGILSGLFLWNHFRQTLKMKNNMEWKTMKVNEQLAHCKLVFSEASQATEGSQYRICHGIHLISILLGTETVDPQIWEEAYQFMVRIQWTIEKMDLGIWHMYSRYLFLQAKKIIDKYGWTQTEPITKRTDKGLMRCVAIRLLSFILHDCTIDEEASKLLEEGFRQLGFKGYEHYPHCGLLWWVMPHCRIYRVDQNPSVEVLFRRKEFVKAVKAVAEAASDEKFPIIPEFGSPKLQAVDALGGSHDFMILRENIKYFFKLENPIKEVAIRFFTAMGTSLYRNPGCTLLYVFNIWKLVSTDFNKSFTQIMPEKEWTPIVERIMKIAVYYGKPFDAKKLQQRCIPSVAAGSQLCNQLSVDQQFFEEAAEAHKEELRKWLAAHTDRDELKKKPKYSKDPRQDARINKGNMSAEVPEPNPNVPPGAVLTPVPEPAQAVPTPDPASPHSPAPVATAATEVMTKKP